MSDDERIDELLRGAYRELPLASPDLEPRVLSRLRRQARPVIAGPTADDRAGRHPLGRITRWGMRAYWLATGCIAVLLVSRAGAAGLGPLTLTLGAVAAVVLLLGVGTVARVTGRTTARLIAGSV